MSWQSSLQVYFVVVILRLVNVSFVQTQFDPDEYWQNLEPAYCHTFVDHVSGEDCNNLTWEWTRRSFATDGSLDSSSTIEGMMKHLYEGPVRSYASILPTLLFYRIVKFVGADSSWMISRGPVFLNAVVVAAPTDWAVWYMSSWMYKTKSTNTDLGQHIAFWSLFCSLSSWFNAYTLVRTYSNSIETMILSLCLCLVSPELLGPTSASTTSKWQYSRACLAFFFGGICCSIRFTCLAAFIPLGIILTIFFQSTRNLRRKNMMTLFVLHLVGICAIPGFFGFLTTICIDRLMYGFWAVPLLGNIHFNVILGNGSLYGTHPFHWYLTAGLPAIAGALIPLLVVDWFRNWGQNRRSLWMICIVYTGVHSFSPHKEFRFLLPILPIFCVLSGERMRSIATSSTRGKLVIIFIGIANMIAVIYLGLFHQRASISINQEILRRVPPEPTIVSVHYLLGCHSTPLLSHLHKPPIRFEPWTLDCSPECRRSRDDENENIDHIECESDALYRDPIDFLEKYYYASISPGLCQVNESTCGKYEMIREIPDFLVTTTELASVIGDALVSRMGLSEVERCVHGINGLKVDGILSVGSDHLSNENMTRVDTSFGVSISLDEFILFYKRETL